MTGKQVIPFSNSRLSSIHDEGFEDYLLRCGHISFQQLQLLDYEKRKQGMDTKVLLVEMGLLTADALAELFIAWNGHESPSLILLEKDHTLHDRFTRNEAEALQVLPIVRSGEHLKIVMVQPHDCVTKDKVLRCFPEIKILDVFPILAADFYRLLDQIYGRKIDLEGGLQDSQLQEVTVFLDKLFKKAIRFGASDIHFEPSERLVRVRLRLDGVLQPTLVFHKDFWVAVTIRLKVLANLNIAESRMPQFGRYSLVLEGRRLDCRLSTHPTQHGESIVIRLLDQNKDLHRLTQLFPYSLSRRLERLTAHPQGLIVVTGPTGSGKTTTLYAMLSAINAQEKKIVTLEDPIEYRLFHIQQTEIHDAIGFSFAEGIRSLLRQDPDVILVGEIRDAETAAMAVRAALTGHLVLTTLHTPDALGALARLQDLGVSKHHLAEVLVGVLAQRLVRLSCKKCASKGCIHCDFTGYQGRQALAELIEFDEELLPFVIEEKGRSALGAALKKRGHISMAQDAQRMLETKAINTTEVTRVLGYVPA